MTTSTLSVYKGEALEDITILTQDSLSAGVDVSWADSTNSKIEIKDKKAGTVLQTLTGTDLLTFTTTTITCKGDKFYILSNGHYFAKVIAKNGAGRTKILSFYVDVRDV